MQQNLFSWCQELVWQIVHDVDIEGSKKTPLWIRSPYLEFEAIIADHAKQLMLVTVANILNTLDIFFPQSSSLLQYKPGLNTSRYINCNF